MVNEYDVLNRLPPTRLGWKTAVSVWRWADAPEEFRALSPFEGGGESVIYVPAELLDEKGEYYSPTFGLLFLDAEDRFPRCFAARDCFGLVTLIDLPCGGRVAITTESESLGGRRFPCRNERIEHSP